MKQTNKLSHWKKALLALASVALLTPVVHGQGTVTAGLNELILGFRADSNPGQTVNLEVDLGDISQFYNAAPGVTFPLSRLSTADLSAAYGPGWYLRTDLHWGAIATTGRNLGTPDGHAPTKTLWATVGNCDPAWNRGSTFAQQGASATIENLFAPANTGGLNGASNTANSAYSALIDATLANSWGKLDTKNGISFGYFNPTIDNYMGTNIVVSQLYELIPTNASLQVGTYLGDLILTDQGLRFRGGSPPQAVCNPNVTLTADPVSCTATATVEQIDGGSTGFCLELSLDNAGPYPAGTTNVTLIAVDGAGRTNICTTSVSVVGGAPSIACPASFSQNNDSGLCSAVVSYPTPSAAGCNQPIGTVVCTPASGTPFPVGPTTVTCTAVDNNSLTGTCSFVVTVVNASQPVISLNGSSTVTVECHGSFTDDGAVAHDDCAANLTVVETGSVNANAVGSYTLTYTANNANGSASVTRTVNVVDTTAPVITVNGANPMTVQCHSAFTDPGATASDACAGSVSVSVSGSVDANTVGSYTLTYSATDGSNPTSATRTVNVVDTTAPVITLNGANPMTVQCHGTFTDPGATANDACAGSVSVSVSGSVDANTVGSYTLTYSATDGSNPTSVTRTVNVVDTTAPVVTLNGSSTVTVECHGSFTDDGATANDACAGALPVTTTGSVNANVPGTYTLTYSATDPSHNTGSASRTVNVVDTTAPVPPVLATVTGQCSATVTAPTAIDACAGTIIGTTGDPTTYNAQGTNIVHWTFNDGHGNISTADQMVIVHDTTPPTVHCPANVSVIVPTGTPFVAVNYPPATATDNCPGVVGLSYSMPSGANFPVGVTTVTVTATDAAGNQATCTFTVTVTAQQPCSTVAALSNKVVSATSLKAGDRKDLLKKLSDMQQKLNDSAQKLAQGDLNGALQKRADALNKLEDFIHKVNDLYKGRKISIGDRNDLLDCAQVLANSLIGDISGLSTASCAAQVSGLNLSTGDKNQLLGDLSNAQQQITQANGKLSQGKYQDCENTLRNAVQQLQQFQQHVAQDKQQGKIDAPTASSLSACAQGLINAIVTP